MSYISQGKITFLTRHVDKREWMKPADQLLKAPIHIGNVSFVLESQICLEILMHCLERVKIDSIN